MSPIRSEVEIRRPPEEVFAYATDPTRFAEWQEDVVRVELHQVTATGGGPTFTTVRRVGGAQRSMTQQVTRTEPPSRWSAVGIDGPVRPMVTLVVEPLEGDTAASRVTALMDFQGHGLGRLLVPLVVRRLAARQAPRSYRRLKERLEGLG